MRRTHVQTKRGYRKQKWPDKLSRRGSRSKGWRCLGDYTFTKKAGPIAPALVLKETWTHGFEKILRTIS